MKIVEIFLFVQINVLMPSFGYCMLRFISCAFLAAYECDVAAAGHVSVQWKV